MNRITEAWFEFKGIRSDEMGIYLRQMATRFVPGVNIERKQISGRDGALKYGPRSYNDVQVRIECDVRDEKKLPAVLAWLTGEGLLRFSDEPEYGYDASVEKEFSRAPIMSRYKGQRFIIVWTCHPFRRKFPEAEDLLFARASSFENPGTAPSLPRITIRGRGSFALTIGMQTAFFSGVEDGIIIDSELGDALTLDGAQLANDKMTGELFKIQPGYNVVSWLTGGEDDEGNTVSGSISEVVITPRWRYI